jgi:hypothetical protein
MKQPPHSKAISNQHLILGVFLIFFAVTLWQHAHIHLSHDDFGYASLSYLGNFNDDIQGHQFSFSQMLNFLQTHYLTWGGRLVPLFTLLSLLRWTFWVFRIAQSVVLTLILFFSMKLILDTDQAGGKGVVIAVILIGLYGLIPIQLHKDGTYWASASVLYVWPFLWIFGAGLLLHSYNTRDIPRQWCLVLLSALFLGIGLSQEQTFFVALGMLLGYLITHILEKRPISVIRVDLLCLLMLMVGFGILILAPGNAVRADNEIYTEFYALTFLQRIREHLPSFLLIVFGQQNLAIFGFLLAANLLALIRFIRDKKQHQAAYVSLGIIHVIFLIIVVILFFANSLISKFPFLAPCVMWVDQVLNHSAWFWFIFLLLVSVPGFLFSYHKRSFILFGIYLGGVAAQLTTLVIPTVNYRYALILMFALFPLLAQLLADSLENLNQRGLKPVILSLLVLLALLNSGSILVKYRQNSPIHRENQRILISSQDDIEHGLAVPSIKLHRLVDDQYSGAMPYMQGYDYINLWIKKYYRIPLQTELIWE